MTPQSKRWINVTKANEELIKLIALIQNSGLFKEYSIHSVGYSLKFKEEGVDGSISNQTIAPIKDIGLKLEEVYQGYNKKLEELKTGNLKEEVSGVSLVFISYELFILFHILKFWILLNVPQVKLSNENKELVQAYEECKEQFKFQVDKLRDNINAKTEELKISNQNLSDKGKIFHRN